MQLGGGGIPLTAVFPLSPGVNNFSSRRRFKAGSNWERHELLPIAHPEVALDRNPRTGVQPEVCHHSPGVALDLFAGDRAQHALRHVAGDFT